MQLLLKFCICKTRTPEWFRRTNILTSSGPLRYSDSGTIGASTSSSAHARSSHCWVGKNGYRFALVNAFAELLDHFLVERREISGLSTRDQPIVRHHLL